MTPRPTTPNVLKIYREATDAERADGHGWYVAARAIAETLAAAEWRRGHVGRPILTDERGDVARAAAVLAVLSPRQSWGRNVELAREAYAMAYSPASLARRAIATLPTLGDQREKVARLLVDREDPDTVVSGPKVRAFWWTITDPADPRAVVVDRHAIDVTVGRVTDDRTRGAITGRRGAYDRVAACYVRAARVLSDTSGTVVTPAEVQATTWVVWRRTRVRNAAAIRRAETS